MRVIWLCSWYPNKEDRYRGDFIKRQALAVSQIISLDIIHIHFGAGRGEEQQQVHENLRETIFYRTRRNALADLLTSVKIHDRFYKEYCSRYGKPDLVHVQVPLPSGIIALWWKKRYGIPFIVTEHYGIYNTAAHDHFKTRSAAFRFFTRKVLKAASRFLPVSHSLGKDVNDMVMPVAYTPVPNVVDTDTFYYKKNFNSQVFRFVHVSNMAELKNVKGILDAMALLASRCQGFECIFVGAKPADLLQYAGSIPSIAGLFSFEDEVSYEEIARLNRECHAGILFSTTESQSCVVLEWLCSGLPVISSDVGGVSELIHESNGILVASGNTTQLAEAMYQMIKQYHNYQREEIAGNAALLYSYGAVAQKLQQIYRDVQSSPS